MVEEAKQTPEQLPGLTRRDAMLALLRLGGVAAGAAGAGVWLSRRSFRPVPAPPEQARRDLFTRGVAPGFFGEPSEHLRLRLEAVNRRRENAPAEAAELLARAAEATPPLQGQLNGRPFQELCDADDLFGGVLEVMAHGRYFWAGLEQVRLVAMNPPRFPRDLLYIPAHLELATEAGEVFLPALYPGSHEHADDQVKLGRMTDWKDLGSGLTQGLGLHTYLIDDDAISLLEWRELRAPE